MEVQLKRPTPGNASPAPYGMSQLNSQVFGGGKFDRQLLQGANQTMTMSCKDVKGKSLTIEGNAVGFATTDAADDKQRWIKVVDSGRKPAYAIVNLATGQAIQIPAAAKLPVRLAPYIAGDTSLLWTAEDAKGGYSVIHEFDQDTSLVLDAVHKGLQVVVSTNRGDDSQLWMITIET